MPGGSFYLLYAIPLVFALLFLAAFRYHRAWLLTGTLFSLAAFSFAGILFLQAYASDNRALRMIAVLPFVFVGLMLTFGVYLFIAFLFWNTYAILKREKRDWKHLLALFLAVGLLLVIFVPRFVDVTVFPQTVRYLSYSVYGLVLFYLLHLTQFVVSVFLCNLSRPRRNQDYIIVLGCWIKNGKAPPLLARRIDRAIAFYHQQEKVGAPPALVLSGGMGPDETCSEAEAMKAYALERGIPEAHLLLEPRSATTLENMRFSKALMDEHAGGKPYRCIYATSNYHALRASIFARRAGLRIHGIGAKTAFYYLPNALLREYIAYSCIYLKTNIAFGVFSLLFGSLILPALLHRLTDFLM